MWGDRDYLLPVQQARAAVKSLPHGQLSVFPDCGHLPHVEHPGRFAAELGTWLAIPRDHP
jgi:4,5:9,10-diseco-3-hydroxy-5,9,17-trioxoandrosta-1(10),2-diene-4-oate hydrolase